MGILYDYIFHYHEVEKVWFAIPRKDFNNYFNEGEKKEKFLWDEEINSLIYTLITK
jgi:hypothetical protein